MARTVGHPTRLSIVSALPPLDSLIFLTNGELHHAYKTGALRNVRDGEVRELWRKENARSIRKETLSCTRGCTETCPACSAPMS